MPPDGSDEPPRSRADGSAGEFSGHMTAWSTLFARLALTGVLLLHASCGEVKRIHRVTVRERDFGVVRSINDETELERFAQIWATRRPSPLELPDDFDFVLDIEGGRSEGRWHYHSAGLARLLSAKRVATFEVADPDDLNALLVVSE